MFWMSCFITTILQLLVDIDSLSDDLLLPSALFVFRDRACNNEKLRMRCPRGTAISVRWAQYGRPSPGECPPVKRLRKEQQARAATTTTPQQMHFLQHPLDCVAPNSLQVVVNLCEDHSQCNVTVSPQLFGSDLPCPGAEKILAVGYRCPPMRTLKEIRDSTFPYSKCEDAAAALTTVTAFMLSFPSDHSNATSTITSASVVNASSVPKINIKSYSEEFLDDVLWTFLFIKENLEKFCLYLSLALFAGVLSVLLVIIVKLFTIVFRYRYCIRQLKLTERSPTERTGGGHSEGETVVERSVRPSPQPERPRREGGGGGGGHHERRTSSPESPTFDYIWDSPVFVHVESPRESPVLGHQPAESPLQSPVWVRAPSAAASPSPVPTSAESTICRLPEHLTPELQLSPSVPCSPVPQTVDGSRPLGEAQSLSMSYYTNPFRHDPYRTERRSRSVRPSLLLRLPFDR